MTDYRAQVRAAIEAVRFRRSGGYSWCGVARRPADAAHPRPSLLWSLQEDLYENFYCRGEPMPPRPGDGVVGRDAELEHALADANFGQGYWQAGWRVDWYDENAAIVTRDGLSVLAPTNHLRRPPDASLATGLKVSIRRGKGSAAFSPGAYIAASNIDLPDGNSSPVVRLYWNLAPPGAIEFMRIVTSVLNEQRIPFRLKAGSNAQMYERSDPVVLYIANTDYHRVLQLTEPAYGELSVYIRPGTPALTLCLAPGLGLAEDPATGESFGRHRCGIIAQALLEAAEHGLTSTESRLEAIEWSFKRAGLSLERPYLNGGSKGSYGKLGLT